jgi:hypothetical protein
MYTGWVLFYIWYSIWLVTVFNSQKKKHNNLYTIFKYIVYHWYSVLPRTSWSLNHQGILLLIKPSRSSLVCGICSFKPCIPSDSTLTKPVQYSMKRQSNFPKVGYKPLENQIQISGAAARLLCIYLLLFISIWTVFGDHTQTKHNCQVCKGSGIRSSYSSLARTQINLVFFQINIDIGI